jgi:mercuric ion transport protein
VNTRTLLGTGLIETGVAALCRFTPVLVVLFGAVGLSAWVGWLDYVLIPALLAFLGLTIYAWRRQRTEANCCAVPGERAPGTPGGQP